MPLNGHVTEVTWIIGPNSRAGGALCEVRGVKESDETARSAIFEFDDREGQPVL